VMPQVKVGHLRAVPMPPAGPQPWLRWLAGLGERLTSTPADDVALDELDALVARMFGLDAEEEARVAAWHRRMAGSLRPHRSGGASIDARPDTLARRRPS